MQPAETFFVGMTTQNGITNFFIFTIFSFVELIFFFFRYLFQKCVPVPKMNGAETLTTINFNKEKEKEKKKKLIEWRHLHSMQNFRQKKHLNCVQLISIDIKLEIFDGMASYSILKYAYLYANDRTHVCTLVQLYTDHDHVFV